VQAVPCMALDAVRIKNGVSPGGSRRPYTTYSEGEQWMAPSEEPLRALSGRELPRASL
jgi:hypothetical protein